ncbi:MAG: hypothetical protein JNM64_19555 [Chloroflexia bacterium]|nr:hypothetical protein [Chloroflexia bacterium]
MISTPAVAQTQPAPPATSAVYACADIQGDSERLACFDEAVGRLRQAEQQGRVVTVDRAQVDNLERQAFGFNLPDFARVFPSLSSVTGGNDAPPRETLESVELQVREVLTRSDGHTRFIMTDGQVWEQVLAESARNVRPGDTVTVRRAALGSYMLSPARSGPAHRVRRQN